MDSIINNIEQFVCDFYAENGIIGKDKSFEQVNDILVNAQKCKEAWIFIWPLLQKEKSLNVQYFAASTLYVKLTRYHFELDQESHEQLRQRITEHLISYLNYPELNIVTTKLISCLAVYVVQTVTLSWPAALQDIVGFFQPNKLPHLPPTKVIQTLLEILSFIPDELSNPYNDKNKKIAARAELVKHAESVLMLVHEVFSEENISDQVTKICLKCFSSWSVGFDTLVIAQNHSNTMTLVLNSVCNESTCHEAVEAIVNIYTSPHMSKYPSLVLVLIEQITVGLEETISKASADMSHAHDFLRDLYMLFIQMGETHTRLLLDALINHPACSPVIIKFFHIILKCSSTPRYFAYDETISDTAFNFWINFLDDLMASDEDRTSTYIGFFRDILLTLMNVMLIKVQYPPDEIYELEMDSDDQEKFRCYRQDIADTFMYCQNIMSESVLQLLSKHFDEALQQAMRLDVDKQALAATTRYLEAVIYVYGALMENVSNVETVYLPRLFSSLQSIPVKRLENDRLLASINTFLSSSSEWLYYNPNYISFCISIISDSIKSKKKQVVVASTMALKLITQECQQKLDPSSSHTKQIIGICEECLSYHQLQYKDKARLMHALGSTLSILPVSEIKETIDRILLPFLDQTEKMLCVDRNNNPDARIHISGVLLMLANLFANLDVNLKGTVLEEGDQLINPKRVLERSKNNIKPQPTYIIFEKVLPLFRVIVSHYSSDEEIAENLCECIKKAVVTLLDDAKPMVGHILELLLHLYQAFASTYVLTLSRQIFIIFYKESEVLPNLQEYYWLISQRTFEEFNKDFRENTVLVQIFYEESAQTLRKSSAIFHTPKLNLQALFDFAISGILLPEKGTIHQCSAFIVEFLAQGRSNELFNAVITQRFEVLVRHIFTVIGGSQGSPSYAGEFMANIILILNLKYSDNFNRTLVSFIECDGFPTSCITREHRTTLVKAIQTVRNNRTKLKDLVKEFGSRCRGLFAEDKAN